MSCIVNSVCKMCRREGQKLFSKGTDVLLTSALMIDGRTPPGQHGQRRMKFSEFALQLREKQKLRRYYGVLESQFRKYYATASGMKGDTGLNLLRQLELRFDNVVYSLGYASSRREAAIDSTQSLFMLNGRRANISSIVLRPGDVVEVKEASRTSAKLMAAVESGQRREVPVWLGADKGQFRGEVKELPAREHVTVPIEENMIVEFYSR